MHSGPAPDVRRQNQRRIVSHLLRSPGLSRAELAQRTRLSPPTVGKVVNELIDRGILAEIEGPAEPRTRSLGRPSRPVALESSTRRIIAIHVGVRKTQLSALPIAGPAADQWQVEFPTPKRPATWAERLADARQRLGPVDCWGIAISTPGVCDEAAGKVLLSPNLHWTEDADLRALVRSVWDVEVVLVQEIRALALGQLAAEPAREDFLLVDFSSGVGGAIVRNSELYSGDVVLSGELGHNPVPGNPRKCGCGGIGCLETLLSRDGLLETLSARKQAGAVTWTDLVAEVERSGVDWLGPDLDAAGMVIAGAMNVTGVIHTVITGAITELPGQVTERLTSAIERTSMWARFGRVRVRSAPRRRASGLVQAAIERLILPVENRYMAARASPFAAARGISPGS